MKRIFVSFAIIIVLVVAAPTFAQVTPPDSAAVAQWEALAQASGMPAAFKKLRGQIAAVKAARPAGYYTGLALGEAAQLFADRQVLNAAGGDSTHVAWVAYLQSRKDSKVLKAAGNQFIAALIQGAMNNGAGAEGLRAEIESLKSRLDTMVSREEVEKIAAEAAAKAAGEEGERIRAWAEGKFRTR